VAPADNTAGAASTDAASPSVEGGGGGFVGDESTTFRRTGVQRIENTWLRRAAVVGFWLTIAPLTMAGMALIIIAAGVARLIVGLGDAFVDAGSLVAEYWRTHVTDLLKVGFRGTAFAWRRR
jgi:hypothetical protein